MVPQFLHHIYAREYEGEGTAIVPMNGFPDSLRLYERLVPYLSPRSPEMFR